MSEDSNFALEIIVAAGIFILIMGFLTPYLLTGGELYGAFLNWFYERDWSYIKIITALVISLINILLVWFVVSTLRRLNALKKKRPLEQTTAHTIPIEGEVKENWEHIRTLINSSNASDWNMAVLRADALLEDILQHLGYEGETIAERLKIVDPTKLPSYDRLWSAHRLRNAIAHDPLEQHTRETIVYALGSYEQALKELGMLAIPKL